MATVDEIQATKTANLISFVLSFRLHANPDVYNEANETKKIKTKILPYASFTIPRTFMRV